MTIGFSPFLKWLGLVTDTHYTWHFVKYIWVFFTLFPGLINLVKAFKRWDKGRGGYRFLRHEMYAIWGILLEKKEYKITNIKIGTGSWKEHLLIRCRSLMLLIHIRFISFSNIFQWISKYKLSPLPEAPDVPLIFLCFSALNSQGKVCGFFYFILF